MKIGKGFTLPDESAEDVIAIIGRRGRGKTNTAVVLVEELHQAGARFVVADPVGVWWGLKSSCDGKAAGISVVVMGGEHQDVPLEESAGKVIADFVADKASPSVILDFRGFRKGQMIRFAADFLEQLYQRNRDPLHVVLDEADQFAPQRVMGETARLVGAAEDVCKMGRARGLLPIVITQRPAALNKNVLTQAGLLVAHQLTGPQDQRAVDDWIRANADEEQRVEFMATIATLERGEAWFWQPEMGLFKRVHVRARRTFDSSATPKRGTKRSEPKAVAEVDMEALKQRIASTIERAKADDPRELRKRIGELERALKARPEAKPAPAPKVVEKAVLKAEHVKRLEAAAAKIAAEVMRAERLGDVARKVEASVLQAAADVSAALRAATAAPPPAAGRGIAALIPDRAAPPRPTPPPASVQRAPRAAAKSHGNGTGGLDGVQQRILDHVLMLETRGLPVSREAVARWMGIHPNGGRFLTSLARLREDGYLDGFTLTEQGREAAMPLETGDAAVLVVIRATKKEGSGRAAMMDTILKSGPFGSRIELAEALGIHPNGGRFLTNLARLREMGVIPEKGEIRAVEGVYR